jgi:predicted metal-dependent hydrolase
MGITNEKRTRRKVVAYLEYFELEWISSSNYQIKKSSFYESMRWVHELTISNKLF